MKGSAAIVGAAETARLGVIPDVSALELSSEAAAAAIADAGLSLNDIDGIATAGYPPMEVSHHLGLSPNWVDGTNVGGSSFLIHVRHAVAAIEAGYAHNVLVAHGESGRSRIGQPGTPKHDFSIWGQFEAPYGATLPVTMFTLPLLRYMKTYGLTERQLASVAVSQRKWSQKNPRALLRDPISCDDILDSPYVVYPFHRAECCLVTDGGGALVVTSADRARGASRPVFIAGTGEAVESPVISQMHDFTTSQALTRSSGAAFAEAGVAPADIDHLMIYDAFAHLPIYGLEDLGFVGRGEAGPYIEAGHCAPGGDLPMNTNGGGLSYTHTGKYGMFAILEAVRQLRGEAAAQVPNVELSLVQGIGGMFASAATLILSSSP